jgi:hypothetical protein
MKAFAALLLLALAEAQPRIEYFHFMRPVSGMPAGGGQACLVPDAGIFAHSAQQLADLRLYRGEAETPYVLHTATAPVESTAQAFDLLNKGLRNGRTSFDAEIAGMAYSDVQLEINAKDFIATVTVTGSRDEKAAGATKLGAYTIFDLSRQRLGRSTVLHLPASDLPYLHFEIAGPVKPEQVTAVTVERLTAVAPVYIAVAASAQTRQRGKSTVVEFAVPAHVPVDRVVVEPGAQPTQFSRTVMAGVTPAAPTATPTEQQPVRVATETLLRVHSVQNGRRLDEERLAFDAPPVDFNEAAKWTVSIDNGDDAPLAIRQVRLEMLERKVCFEAAAGAAYTLYYGDASLQAPRYDYATLFAERADAAQLTTGAEQPNPAFKTRPDERPFTEKHPVLLWVALVAVVALLGGVALRSAPAKPNNPTS